VLSLERAKAAPLTIHLNIRGLKRDPGFLDLLLPHHQKTRSLSVIKPVTIDELTQTLPNFPRSMPNLRSLDLSQYGLADWTQTVDPFDFSAHTLTELSLSDIPLYPSFLSLRSLTELSLVYCRFDLHVDTLLEFLEENHSLERASLEIAFEEPSLRHSRRQDPIGNRLQLLSISCHNATDSRALLSAIALRRGAALEIYCNAKLIKILSGVSVTHLQNLSSPTFMEYQTLPRTIRLVGPDGSFLFDGYSISENPFQEFPLLPLDSIREFRLEHYTRSTHAELHLSSFPSLEVLAIDGTDSGVPLSTVLPDPASSSLKTLAFLNCAITEGFVGELVRFASCCEKRTLASLHRVVIIDSSDEQLPSVASIARLRKYVPAVEVREGRELPKDLS